MCDCSLEEIVSQTIVYLSVDGGSYINVILRFKKNKKKLKT